MARDELASPVASDGLQPNSTHDWRLPRALLPLSGWPRTLFLSVWGALLIFALVGSVRWWSNQTASVRASAEAISHEAGLILQGDGEVGTLGPPTSSAARIAGIRNGDKLTRIDGEPAGADWSTISTQLDGAYGSTVVLETVDSAGKRRQIRLARDPARDREGWIDAGMGMRAFLMSIAGMTFVADALVQLACAILLMWRRSRDALAPWASLTMMLGAASQFPWLLQGTGFGWLNDAFVYLNWAMIAAVLAVLPAGRFDSRWVWPVLLAAAACVPTGYMASTLVFIWLWGATVAAAVGLICIRYWRMQPGIGRQQIRWALLAIAAAAILIAATLVMRTFVVPQTSTLSAYICRTSSSHSCRRSIRCASILASRSRCCVTAFTTPMQRSADRRPMLC